jgi:hypothetical protein
MPTFPVIDSRISRRFSLVFLSARAARSMHVEPSVHFVSQMYATNESDDTARTWLSYVLVMALGFLGPTLLGTRLSAAGKLTHAAESSSPKIGLKAGQTAPVSASKDSRFVSPEVRPKASKDALPPAPEFIPGK